MPRLQILQHKSYHPYLEKNKQRVREDEARALAEEVAREQKQINAESEARLDILRRRAGSPSLQAQGEEHEPEDLPSTSSVRDSKTGSTSSLLDRHRREKLREEKREKKKRDRLDFDFPSEQSRRAGKVKERDGKSETDRDGHGERDRDGGRGREGDRAEKWETGGHVNLFADLEREHANAKPQPTLAELAKIKKDQETDPYTVYLGRPDKETKPWYADRNLKRVEDTEVGEEAEERRARDRRKDARSKNRHDPLTQITTLLSSSSSKPSSSHLNRHPPHARHSQHPHPSYGHLSNSNLHAHSHPSNLSASASEARKARELSERERALALISKSKAPLHPGRLWDDSPSSIGSGGGRTWADDWERQKAKAGSRFFADSPSQLRSFLDDRPRDRRPPNGRSWEV